MEISQKIVDYAIWYYLKYYPSPNKMKFKLKEKFWPESKKWKIYGWINDDEIDFIVFDKLKNIISEEEVIDSKIRNFINKWKSKTYIKQKLFERMEDKDLSDKYLNIYFENWEEENIKKQLKKLWFSENLEYNYKQKILKKLLNKGFRYDEVKEIIN